MRSLLAVAAFGAAALSPVVLASNADAAPPSSCAEATAPIYRGSPDYSRSLDHGNNGIACENAGRHKATTTTAGQTVETEPQNMMSATSLPHTGVDAMPALEAGAALAGLGVITLMRARRA